MQHTKFILPLPSLHCSSARKHKVPHDLDWNTRVRDLSIASMNRNDYNLFKIHIGTCFCRFEKIWTHPLNCSCRMIFSKIITDQLVFRQECSNCLITYKKRQNICFSKTNSAFVNKLICNCTPKQLDEFLNESWVGLFPNEDGVVVFHYSGNLYSVAWWEKYILQYLKKKKNSTNKSSLIPLCLDRRLFL